MIPKILRPQDLEYSFAIIMPDMEQPWNIMEQCDKWMKILKDQIFKVSPNLPIKQLDFLKDRVEEFFKTF